MTKRIFGRANDGTCIFRDDGGQWRPLTGITLEELKAALETPWPFEGSRFAGQSLKDICKLEADYLEWHIHMLRPDEPIVTALRVLFPDGTR